MPEITTSEIVRLATIQQCTVLVSVTFSDALRNGLDANAAMDCVMSELVEMVTQEPRELDPLIHNTSPPCERCEKLREALIEAVQYCHYQHGLGGDEYKFETCSWPICQQARTALGIEEK